MHTFGTRFTIGAIMIKRTLVTVITNPIGEAFLAILLYIKPRHTLGAVNFTGSIVALIASTGAVAGGSVVTAAMAKTGFKAFCHTGAGGAICAKIAGETF